MLGYEYPSFGNCRGCMNVCNCLNPVRVSDPHHVGRFMYVPCGHCDVCRNRTSQDWVHRLQCEAECWQYTMFVTLTYDDSHLPFVTLDTDTNRLLDVSTGQVFDYIPKRKELNFIRKMQRLSYPNVRDFQLFIKRLRYFWYEYKKKNQTNRGVSSGLRYFFTFEYGPTTHRIHLHGLFFFNDKKGDFVRNFAAFVNHAWQNGNVDCSPVQGGSAARYVAKYSNVDVSRKGLYNSPEFRARHLQSKNPPIGSLLVNNSTLRALFESSSVVYRYRLADTYTDGSLPLYIKDRLWPKIPEFDRLTDCELLSIYSLAKQYRDFSAVQFVDYFRERFIDSHEYPCLIGVFGYLTTLINERNKDPYSAIARVFRMSKRVITQAEIFNISLTYYIQHLKNYYHNVSLQNLRSWFELQESAQKTTPKLPIQSWPSLDLEFMRWFDGNTPLSLMPDWVLMTLDGFGLDPIKYVLDSKYRERYDIKRFPRWTSYVSQTKKIYEETHKIKAKKEYERKHGFTKINEQYAKYF